MSLPQTLLPLLKWYVGTEKLQRNKRTQIIRVEGIFFFFFGEGDDDGLLVILLWE